MNQTSIYSIGHGNKTIDEFVSVLQLYSIKYLIDVRSVPYSKFHTDFNQEALKRAIEATGNIGYLYMGDVLGGLPKDESLKTNGKMDYTKMKEVPEFKNGISRLLCANEKQIRVCVMCSESDPSHCHRSKLIGEALREKGVNMQHIVKNKNNVYVTKPQNYVINEANPNGPNDIFGDKIPLTSVKEH